MRKGNESSLKEAIRMLLNAYKLTPKIQEAKLQTNWEKIMGTSVANRTKELFIKNDKLYLRITSSTLREELTYSRDKIISLVNEELEEVVIKEVIFL